MSLLGAVLRKQVFHSSAVSRSLPPLSPACPCFFKNIRGSATSFSQGEAINFDDGKAFHLKTNWEIFRGLLIFRMCSYPFLVNNSMKLMQLTRKALGQKLFSAVMKASAYGQFVAGETLPEIQQSMEKLKRMGIRPMLAVPIEEDIGEDKEGEKWYDRNLDTMIRCVDISITGGKRSKMQLKVTALMSAELCKTITHHLKDPVTRKSLSFESLVRAMDGQTLHLSCLTKEENHHFLASLQRFNKIGQYAKDNKVRVLVDAEYTYINPALTLVTLAMMMKFNQSVPWIWNTYQCYLKEAYNLINEDIELSSRLGFCFGAKLVRGAYMDKERKLAKEKGYPDPINENWEATNRSYQRVLDRMLDLVGENSERYNIIVASHNEASVKQAIRRIETMKISKEGGAVCFGQLLGMCDHVSMTLGQKGYAIYKSIPYGPIDDVMPYLVRRAQENQSVLLGIRKERDLLQKELKRRIFFRGRKNAENNVDYTLPTDKR